MPVRGGVVTRTTAGAVAGEQIGRVVVWRGVPYAAAPVGALRFASPRPPLPWDGVRDATSFAPASLQAIIPGSSEDSLYANVWSPGVDGARPVLVYIHGGGWMVGAGSLDAYSGARLAERGDVVVVTFNYRLGVFGFGAHEDLVDPDTGSFANWGLQDQAAALRWVRDNAAAFGGDPDNITLAGTSAGGAGTWQLALLPETRALIRRIIPISACHVWAPATSLGLPDARATYEALAGQLGTTVRGLREVPAEVLADAWDKFFSGDPCGREVAGGREFRGPVVDGRWMPGYDHELPTPDVPMMVVHTSTEGSFYTGPHPPQPAPTPAPTTDAELRTAVRAVLHKGASTVHDSLVDACISAYREAAVDEGRPADPLWLWTEIWGDALFRYHIVRLSERHAREGRTPQYVMEFAHPVLPPYFGTPHEATSPHLFGTYADREALRECWNLPVEQPVFAVDENAAAVSENFMDLVASFARDGVPTSAAVPVWPDHDPEAATTLVLGGERIAALEHVSKVRQLRFWDDAGWIPRA